MRRRGLPSSLQARKVGKATRSTSTRPRIRWPTRGSRRRFPSAGRASFFSFVQGVWGGDPALRPHPANSENPRKRRPHGLPAEVLFGQPLLEGDIGGHLQSPHTRLASELPRRAVEHLP